MTKMIQWMCTACGQKISMVSTAGRPSPGTCKKKNGRPHSWVKNKVSEYGK